MTTNIFEFCSRMHQVHWKHVDPFGWESRIFMQDKSNGIIILPFWGRNFVSTKLKLPWSARSCKQVFVISSWTLFLHDLLKSAHTRKFSICMIFVTNTLYFYTFILNEFWNNIDMFCDIMLLNNFNNTL